MAPQAVLVFPGWHLPELSQQPIRQFIALHEPPPEPELLPEEVPELAVAHEPRLQVPPAIVQFWQGPPPTPHAVSAVPCAHMGGLLLSQQPIEQFVMSHGGAPVPLLAPLGAPLLPVELPLVLPLGAPVPDPLVDPLSLPLPLPLLAAVPLPPLASSPPLPPPNGDPDADRGALASL
jgi:hypothetical protein